MRLARLRSQSGSFTFHPPDSEPIDDLLTPITVPAAAKPALRTALRMMGMGWFSMFPDEGGLAQELTALLHDV